MILSAAYLTISETAPEAVTWDCCGVLEVDVEEPPPQPTAATVPRRVARQRQIVSQEPPASSRLRTKSSGSSKKGAMIHAAEVVSVSEKTTVI